MNVSYQLEGDEKGMRWKPLGRRSREEERKKEWESGMGERVR